jgi:antitoxin (DNA-binding transcriptional repressor) of toxin-antitoxin stability system
MKSVNIAELKDKLSAYLQRVRRGEAILVRDRDEIIARIEPVSHSPQLLGDDAWLAELERRGVARRGRRRLPKAWSKDRPKVKADLIAALLSEREEGR